MERRFGAILVAVALMAFGTACKTKEGPTDPDDAAQLGSGSGTGSEFDDGSSGAGSSTGTSTISDLETVYFDYDQSAIRSDSAEVLRRNAESIKGNAAWGEISIQGNTDERGSEEYNLALGERRAGAVQRYLVDLGVSASRLRTVSFGEAKPAVPGHDESAYRYNRRSDFASR
jgi:peptidoglycan-associated lipoprotein